LVARVRARDQALRAGGGGPAPAGRPPQRHIEQDHRPDMESCEGVRGAKLPELFSFFWYSLERKLVLDGAITHQAVQLVHQALQLIEHWAPNARLLEENG